MDLKKLEKIKKANHDVRMALSRKKDSLSFLKSTRQEAVDCNFHKETIDAIDLRINQAQEIHNKRLKKMRTLVKNGLKENIVGICKKCRDLHCKVTVSQVHETSIIVSCGKQETCINPDEFHFFKSAQLIS